MFLFLSDSGAQLLRLDEAAAMLVDRPSPCDLLTGEKCESSSLDAFMAELQAARLEVISASLRGHLSIRGGAICRDELERWRAGRIPVANVPAAASVGECDEPLVLREAETSAVGGVEGSAPTAIPIDLTDKKQRESVKRLVLAILEELDRSGRRFTQKEVGRHPALDIYREAYLAGVPKERMDQREKSFLRAFVAPACQLRKAPTGGKPRKSRRAAVP